MPTDKPRVSIVLSDDLLSDIENYRFMHGLKSISKAINELILKGLTVSEETVVRHQLFSDFELLLLSMLRKATDAGRADIMKTALSVTKAVKGKTYYDLPENEPANAKPIDVNILDAFIHIYPSLSPDQQNSLMTDMLKMSKGFDEWKDLAEQLDPTAAAAERAEPLGSLDINDNSI